MGSDFSYSDIAGRTLDQDSHAISKQNDKYYVIESTPKSAEDAYSRFFSTIDKKTMVVRSIAFYDRKGEKLKTLTNRKIIIVNGVPLVSLSVMENHRTGGKSTMDRGDIKVDVNFSDKEVGLKGLKSN